MCALCLGLPKQAATSNSRSSKQRNWRGKMVLKKASNQIETKCLLTVYAVHVYDTWALLYRSFYVAWAIQCFYDVGMHSIPSHLSPPLMIVSLRLHLSTASRLCLPSLCRLRRDFSFFHARLLLHSPHSLSPNWMKLRTKTQFTTANNRKGATLNGKKSVCISLFSMRTHTGTHARSHAHTFRNSTQCDLHCW